MAVLNYWAYKKLTSKLLINVAARSPAVIYQEYKLKNKKLLQPAS